MIRKPFFMAIWHRVMAIWHNDRFLLWQFGIGGNPFWGLISMWGTPKSYRAIKKSIVKFITIEKIAKKEKGR